MQSVQNPSFEEDDKLEWKNLGKASSEECTEPILKRKRMTRNRRTVDKASIAECTEPILQRKRMSKNGRTVIKQALQSVQNPSFKERE